MKDNELFRYLEAWLRGIYRQVVSNPSYYIFAVGEHQFCLVAHIDTVREPGQRIELVRIGNLVWNLNGILGADDRAGIYGILRILEICRLRKMILPSVLLTNYEESFGLGMRRFIIDEVLDGSMELVIALDRMGCNQYVHYSGELPPEVETFIESFGFIKNVGIYSDIADLGEAYGIPAVNLSIGYYFQHTPSERLHINEMWLTIWRVVMMLTSLERIFCYT